MTRSCHCGLLFLKWNLEINAVSLGKPMRADELSQLNSKSDREVVKKNLSLPKRISSKKLQSALWFR